MINIFHDNMQIVQQKWGRWAFLCNFAEKPALLNNCMSKNYASILILILKILILKKS